MHDDETAIGMLIETWLSASRSGDVPTLLGLMSDDVVFMVPGREPFGKREFAAQAAELKGLRIDAVSDVKELVVHGTMAYCRTHLTVSVTPPGGEPMRRSGYTLSIFQKREDGRWVISRDANMLSA